MRWKQSFAALALTAVLLSGCSNPFAPTPVPDYRVRVVQQPNGQLEAVAPDCVPWQANVVGSLQNDPWPQYGCASTRNLAAMVDRPEDLIQGRESGPANAETTSSGMERYLTGKTKALIDPNAKAPVSQTTQSGGMP